MYLTELSLAADTDVCDINAALEGLLELLHIKLFRLPSSHAVRVYIILLNHLEQHYKKPTLFLHHPDVRLKVNYNVDLLLYDR